MHRSVNGNNTEQCVKGDSYESKSFVLLFSNAAFSNSAIAITLAEGTNKEYADGIEQIAIEKIDFDLQKTIDQYFDFREDVLSKSTADSKQLTLDSSNLLVSRAVSETEISRSGAVQNLAKYHNVYVVDCQNETNVTKVVQKTPTQVVANVFEWTWLQYNDGQGGPIDLMGYATEHCITLEEQDNGQYLIVSDCYDESDILGVPEIGVAESFASCEEALVQRDVNGVNSSVDLNLNVLIDYADRWVVHEYASAMQNPANYNINVYGYYSADCANFTSQCLWAGGMRDDYGSGKDYGNWDGTQWWFDTYPSPNNENYTVAPPSWRYVPKFVEYWVGQGYSRLTATNETVFPGNPVINSSSGEDKHVGICVGYNSSGVPIINAHNRDVYHVPYTMIGGGTKTTIAIMTSNGMVLTPEDAMEISPSNSEWNMLNYLVEGANQYFRIVVSSSNEYTFESAYYSADALDMKATLYKESQTSNGQVLYLYEVATDDDSGSALNFKITATLTPGVYYLRTRASTGVGEGYYYLKHRLGS